MQRISVKVCISFVYVKMIFIKKYFSLRSENIIIFFKYDHEYCCHVRGFSLTFVLLFLSIILLFVYFKSYFFPTFL